MAIHLSYTLSLSLVFCYQMKSTGALSSLFLILVHSWDLLQPEVGCCDFRVSPTTRWVSIFGSASAFAFEEVRPADGDK